MSWVNELHAAGFGLASVGCAKDDEGQGYGFRGVDSTSGVWPRSFQMGGDLFWKWIAGPQMEGGNAFSIPTSLAKTLISGHESREPGTTKRQSTKPRVLKLQCDGCAR